MLSAERVDCDLKPSKLYLLAISGVSIGALCGLVFAGLPLALTLALSFAVIVSSADAARLHGLRAGDMAVVRMVCDAGGWWLWFASGALGRVHCRGEILVLRWLVVLNFVDESGKRIAVVVLPDTLGPHAFRRLRVFLRLFNQNAGEPAAYPGRLVASKDNQV